MYEINGTNRRCDRGPKATVLKALVETRFRDGAALWRTRIPERYGGAVYIAGYGLECALKARICAERRFEYLPRKYWTHDLNWLASQTNRWNAIVADRGLHTRFLHLTTEWEVTMRYAKRPYEAQGVWNFIVRAREFAEEIESWP
jgi:hypothetical protein